MGDGKERAFGNQTRLLTYIDLLGVRDLLSNAPEKVAGLLEAADEAADISLGIANDVGSPHRDIVERNRGSFSVSMYADNVLMYSRDLSAADLRDVVYLAQRMTVMAGVLHGEILSRGIPARGIVTYGQLAVLPSRSSKASLITGAGLLEAVKLEPSIKIIAIGLAPGLLELFRATAPYEFSRLVTSGVIVTAKGQFDVPLGSNSSSTPLIGMLLPLLHIEKHKMWRKDTSPGPFVGALRFLWSEHLRFLQNGDFSSDIAVKYHATVAFLREAALRPQFEGHPQAFEALVKFALGESPLPDELSNLVQ